jgi:hypothetical protein
VGASLLAMALSHSTLSRLILRYRGLAREEAITFNINVA